MARVLVVDDEADIRRLVRMSLELAGHEVSEAADGDEGMRKLSHDRPDALVLDVTMPVVDGWEVLTRLKGGGGPLASVPVVMLTARAGPLDRIRGGIEGAVRYVAKPFSPEDLVEALRLAIEDGPEPEVRRRVQREALESLAVLERGGTAAGGGPRAPRPHVTRLGPAEEAAPARSRPRRLPPVGTRGLSDRQEELLLAVAEAPTVQEAAERLRVSRSNVYASLRRIARRLGVASVPELLAMARREGERDGR